MTENKELTKDELRLLELMRGLGEGYWAGDLQIMMDLGWTRAKTKKVARELTVRGYMKRMTYSSVGLRGEEWRLTEKGRNAE